MGESVFAMYKVLLFCVAALLVAIKGAAADNDHQKAPGALCFKATGASNKLLTTGLGSQVCTVKPGTTKYYKGVCSNTGGVYVVREYTDNKCTGAGTKKESPKVGLSTDQTISSLGMTGTLVSCGDCPPV